MSVSARWRAASLLAALVVSFAFPAAAAAVVSGGCTAEGHSTSTSIDIANTEVWHLYSGERAGGSGTSPVPMRSASVGAYAFGFLIPIAQNSGNGATSGSVDDQPVSNFATLGKVFVVAGRATGDGASCDGQILVVIDDVNALFTLLGGGGLAVFVLALAVLLMASRSSGCAPKILATIFGGLGGAGLALSLEQFQVISPTSYAGLAVLIAGAVLGFLVAGMFGKPKGPKPAASGVYKGSLEPRPKPVSPEESAMLGAVDLGEQMLEQPDPGESPNPPVAPPPPVDESAQKFIEDVAPPDGGDRPVGGGSPN